ncbi:hypothetical protein AJ88_17465 [Mesorhizobium amorphae CCBAU 01583]|nr:hypothetical protein AJ88_17465 [Mesorhizobium amorphae CCBAU 01583]
MQGIAEAAGGRHEGCGQRHDGVEIEERSAMSAKRSRCAIRFSYSPAWTRPRWRSGRLSVGSRRMAPTTGRPSASIASPQRRRWRSLPRRLSTTPAMRTSGS